jgi:UDP-N-acetylglucosamine 1-carboxyvinyltransferase
MDRIRVRGERQLNGSIPISGAKNAALPLMIAALLTPEPLVLNNVPRLADVKQLERILESRRITPLPASAPAAVNVGRTVHLTARNVTPPRPMISSRACALLRARAARRVAEARGRCRAAAPSARGRSIAACAESSAPNRYRKWLRRRPAKNGRSSAEIDFPNHCRRTHTALMRRRSRAEPPCCATPRANPKSSILPTAHKNGARIRRRPVDDRNRGVARSMATRRDARSREAGAAMAAMTGATFCSPARAPILQAGLDASAAGAASPGRMKDCG